MAPAQELDDFGLPIRKYSGPPPDEVNGDGGHDGPADPDSLAEPKKPTKSKKKKKKEPPKKEAENLDVAEKDEGLKAPDMADKNSTKNSDDEDFQDAPLTPMPKPPTTEIPDIAKTKTGAAEDPDTSVLPETKTPVPAVEEAKGQNAPVTTDESEYAEKVETKRQRSDTTSSIQAIAGPTIKQVAASKKANEVKKAPEVDHSRNTSTASASLVMSEFSHQQLTTHKDEAKDNDDGEWQTMPAYAAYDMYDDDNRLVAKEHNVEEEEVYGYAGLGGAGKGYTRVLDDEDVASETSMDGNTKYLFKDPVSTSIADEMDAEQRDAISQLQATKDLLTEGQRIAYVGVTRLELSQMQKESDFDYTKKTKKDVQMAAEALRMWSQKIMVRLYAHMEISPAEQIMIEQLAAHGVMPQDLTPVLMQNARVKNPMADEGGSTPGTPGMGMKSPGPSSDSETPGTGMMSPRPSSVPETPREEEVALAPPPYEAHDGEEMPEVKTPSQLPHTAKIDIDLRWTVLCDLFLVLIADSIYDARSRVLLERIGNDLEVPWIDICRFEKRVTDALEMQQAAEKENWNEGEHLENRRKLALKKRYVMMGLATVGGGLVIGLSAGLLAPLIGAGLAAGFTTIGVGGTSSFLAGAGGAAIITSGAAASGSFMGGKAAGRRMGSVRTFEYRPLHNNKRVNLIVTVSGWMTSKVDDVRLPFSTVDPIMGDIYSILWEPELLTSMGDTINILATEVS